MALVKVNKDGLTHTIEKEWLPSFLEDGWAKGAATQPPAPEPEQELEDEQEQEDEQTPAEDKKGE